MKTIKILFLLIILSFSCYSQDIKIKNSIDSLKYISIDPLNCNSIVWRIITYKKKAIPYLIEKINDTTPTIAIFKCKNSPLRVGDLCYYTLGQIISLPTFDITSRQFDLYEDGCQVGVYNYIEENRAKFQKQVATWYKKNIDNFTFVYYEQKYISDCRKKYNITGYYCFECQ